MKCYCYDAVIILEDFFGITVPVIVCKKCKKRYYNREEYYYRLKK